MSSYVKPDSVVESMAQAGEYKSGLKARDVIIRGFLSGLLLGYATSLAYAATVQTGLPIVGALIFPVGFVMIVLLGLELVTGNFALMPVAAMDGRIGAGRLGHNWGFSFLGNLLGSIFYAVIFAAVATKLGIINETEITRKVVSVAEAKTLAYQAAGLKGTLSAFMSAILCNFMVSLGTVMAFTSKDTTGKILAMWLPILTFFAQGYEHAVVNMFVIPAGMLLGADVSFADWWLWNQIPVTLGNIVGGAIFTGLSLYITHGKGLQLKAEERRVAKLVEELEAEHNAISKLITASGPEVEQKLFFIKKSLIDHIAKEDTVLYPALKRLSERNASLKKALESALAEGDSARLLKRLERATAAELERLLASIKARMGKEEDVLNEYKKMKAC